MSDKTKIPYVDSTCNWWTGCTKTSPGCQNCFAESLAKRYGWGEWGKRKPRHKFAGAAKSLERMNRKPWAFDDGNTFVSKSEHECLKRMFDPARFYRRRIFHNDLSDTLDCEAPIEWLAEELDGIRKADQCEHILCTKRPENFFDRLLRVKGWELNQPRPNGKTTGCPIMDEYHPFYHWIHDWDTDGNPPKNLTILTTVEDQQRADERIPHLLRIPAARRGLSMEPLLGHVVLPSCNGRHDCKLGNAVGHSDEPFGGINVVIVGCEKLPGNRPGRFADGYAMACLSLRDQCAAANVCFYHKQMPVLKQGKWVVSAEPKDWPIEFRVREWPK